MFVVVVRSNELVCRVSRSKRLLAAQSLSLAKVARFENGLTGMRFCSEPLGICSMCLRSSRSSWRFVWRKGGKSVIIRIAFSLICVYIGIHWSSFVFLVRDCVQ